MGEGFLQVNVYAGNIGQPVQGALVAVSGHGLNTTLRSDENGACEKIALKCPDKKFSLEEQRKVRPYSRYVIKVKKEGLRSAQVNGVWILDGETAVQKVFLRGGAQTGVDAVDIPEHSLWGDYAPAKDSPDPDEEERGPLELPEYLLVHDGLPDESAAGNYRMAFAEYIKNAVSAGVYATWPPEAVKAHIHAVLSFTLHRLYHKWYASAGYPFDISAGPFYDQLYVRGGPVFLSVSQAVDQALFQYIKVPGQEGPFCARCDDGARFGAPGRLSKWGAKDLAERGLSALQILRRYYGRELDLASCGTFCREPGGARRLQAMLNIIAASYPGIPRIAPADGRNRAETEKAVRAFQELFGLPASGQPDPATRHHISYVYKSVLWLLRGRYIF
ncbi:MAG: peptidoglycan-binding protein [Clostridiales bacterium]|nr:peptidoglycan-binding protein [Clostridiales bacterium]